MPLTRVVTDTFGGGVDVPITSHTSDTGQTWNNWNGAVRVRPGGYASNAATNSGNRANVNEPVGGPYFDVSVAITVPGISGNALFAGPSGRHSAASGTADGYEFTYERETNIYRLAWGVGGGTSVTVAASPAPVPGTILTLRFRPTIVEGLVNGVVVLSTTVQLNPTSQVAGFLVGSFLGGSLDTVRADNFTVDLWTEDPSGIEGVGVGSYGYGASGTGSVTPLATLTVALMEGATEIASWVLTPDAMTTDELTLTTPQRDAITDWSALELVLSHSGDFARSRVEFAQVETPPLILPVEGVGVGGFGYGGAGTGDVTPPPISGSGGGLLTLTAGGVGTVSPPPAITGGGGGLLTLTASGAGTVSAPGAITGSGVGLLTLTAGGAATVGAPPTITGSGIGLLTLTASGTGAVSGPGTVTGSGVGLLTLTAGGAGTVSPPPAITGSGGGLITLTAGGTGTVSSPGTVLGSGVGLLTLTAFGIGTVAPPAGITGSGIGLLTLTASGTGTAQPPGPAQILNPMEIRLTRAPSITITIRRTT